MARAAVVIEYQGAYRKLLEVCRDHGIDSRTVLSRINKGWSLDDALAKRPRPYPKDVRRPRPSMAGREAERLAFSFQPANHTCTVTPVGQAAELLDLCVSHLSGFSHSEAIRELVRRCHRWLRANRPS